MEHLQDNEKNIKYENLCDVADLVNINYDDARLTAFLSVFTPEFLGVSLFLYLSVVLCSLRQNMRRFQRMDGCYSYFLAIALNNLDSEKNIRSEELSIVANGRRCFLLC